MATVTVSPGICGFTSTIKATVDDMYNVQLEIVSECPHIQKMAQAIQQLSAFDEIRKPITESAVYQAARPTSVTPLVPSPAPSSRRSRSPRAWPYPRM